MIEIILSISDINHALERVLELMLMFFAPISKKSNELS